VGKRGRKSGLNEKRQETFIRLAKEGKTLPEIAGVIGVSSRTLTNWMRLHPDLFLAVREARLIADELVEAALFRRATGYSHPETKVFIYEGCPVTEEITKHYAPDTQAAMFWLRNRQPDRWREKNESDVNVSTQVNVNQLSDAELDARIAELLTQGKKDA
jgi:hypothetical protein